MMTGKSAAAVQQLQALSKDKAALLQLILDKKARTAQEITPSPRRPTAGVLRAPASWAQQRLWFIDLLGTARAAYYVPMAMRLRGVLDQGALHAALNELVRRHEVLRTTFVNQDGQVLQEIHPTAHFDLAVLDLRPMSASERERQAHTAKLEEARALFDLRAGPLIRGKLLRLSDADHLLLITMHHIISDGWSGGVLVRELAQLYSACRCGKANPLQPLPIQYADYAQWQQRWLQGKVLESQLDYWRTHLEGAPPQLELPTDRPRPAVQSHRGEDVRVTLDAHLTSRLKRFAREHGLTLFMTLYAGWAILLARLSGQSHVVIGTPIANRQRPELEGLIGFFANTLPLRVEVPLTLSIPDFLKRVRSVTLGAYAHQDLPFEKMVEALRPERDLARNPIFQVMLSLQTAPQSELEFPDLHVSYETESDNHAMFDLLLSLQETAAGLEGTAGFATDLFDRETIATWIDSFAVLLESLVAGVHGTIGALPILSPSERHRVLHAFNTDRPIGPERVAAVAASQVGLIHHIFEHQADRTPDAIALVYQGRSVSYAQLNIHANRVATYLRNRGVRPDERVGLFLERGPGAIVGILAILKAGGAYVPLDPSLPPERLRYMVIDAAPKVVLTQSCHLESLPRSDAEILVLDQILERHTGSALNPRADAIGLQAAHLAYVIYTSGSTGRPKGVMVEHRQVVNHWHALEPLYRAPVDCRRIGLNAALTFDASVQQWVQLLSGCTLHILPQSVRLDARKSLQFIQENRLDSVDCTPSQLKTWIDAGLLELENVALLTVLVGGEPIDAPMWARLVASHFNFYNVYGPTECTVDSTAAHLHETSSEPNIGRPLHNAKVYILDPLDRPVPTGVAGEIHIGGAGVARGYLNRADLTAERFVTDPFDPTPDARLYATGDLGRWRRDGSLEYLGRNDDQVKIRGFRIEPAEITAVLTGHELVKEAVVLAREDVPGDRRLVAYVVPREPASELSSDSLRAYLKARLPEHMIPAAIMVLDGFPLGPSGKLDRHALPKPDESAYVTRPYEPPQGEIEEILTGIWQSLLGLGRIGRRDNFFELGGHSLLIVQMMERLRRLGLATEVRQVFEAPTLEHLAKALRPGSTPQMRIAPCRIPPGCTAITPDMLTLVELEREHIEKIEHSVPGGAANVQDIYPLAPLQEGILFHHLLGEGHDAYTRALLLSLPSREKLDDLVRALQAVIDRHDSLRTAVLWEQLPTPIQVVWRQAPLSVETLQLDSESEPGQQMDEKLRRAPQRLDLRQAPLMRLRIARDPHGARWYALLLTHHLICDNESLEILLSEASILCEHPQARLESPIPYRVHIAQVVAGTQARLAETFFRDRFGDFEEPTTPFGVRDIRGDGSQILTLRRVLEPAVSDRIRRSARRLNVSTATIFHAAWALVIAHTSGREEAVFGTVLSGRMQGSAGAQRILGMFINTLPLRLQLKNCTATDLVNQTQRELIDLLTHEQTSLAQVQRWTGIAAGGAVFSAVLNYRHSVADSERGWPNIADATVLATRGGTNYPILLSIDDSTEGFALELEADPSVPAPQRLITYTEHALQALVEALAQVSQARVLQLTILPPQEREQLLRLFNPPQTLYPREKLIHQLFEDQAARTPQAQALIASDGSLTYAGLNQKANQLARHLRSRGIGPDHRVGLCLERGSHLLVGLLGILKAGAAYVPLDPHFPTERLDDMITDAAPPVLITQSSLKGRFAGGPTPLLGLDDDWNEIALQGTDNLEPAAVGLHSRHLAYVIYTSGSTGKPKGVMVEHTAVVNLLVCMRQAPGISAGDTLLAVTTISFDIAALEMFLPLATGARIVLATREEATDAAALAALLVRHNVSLLQATPITWQLLLSNGWPGKPDLKALCGGEALSTTLSSKLVDRVHSLWNLYGPTETTIYSCGYPVTGGVAHGGATEPIGHPLANTRIYLLDAGGCPVPPGVQGEIYIGGAGVARGYLNRPELTAERFQLDPYGTEPGERMYKTGDLGRWRADGTLEYLGRNDHQVKLRGYRIELGEIESHLTRHPLLGQALVVLREDPAQDKTLVAYVIPAADCPPSHLNAEILRGYLKQFLPEYMVPSAFVVLEQFPLTPNRKVDRRALPHPGLEAYATRTYEVPVTEVERHLAEIWQELLRVARVGRSDHFFELGGHSLHLIKLNARIAADFAVNVSVPALFSYPTLRQMADAIESLQLIRTQQTASHLEAHRGSREELIALVERSAIANLSEPHFVPRSDHARAPLTFSQRAHWNLYQLARQPSFCPVLSVTRLRGKLDGILLAESLRSMSQRHEALRTQIAITDDEPSQQVLDQVEWQLNRHDLTSPPPPLQGTHVNRVVEEIITRAIDVTRAPLSSSHLLKLAEEDHVLVLTVEHIVCDQYSMSLLLRDLLTDYCARWHGVTPNLPSIPLQFADFAQWQQSTHRTVLQKLGQYWSECATRYQRLNFPHEPQSTQTSTGWGFAPVHIDRALKKALSECCRTHRTTLVTGAFAAYAALALRWCDVRVGTLLYASDGRISPNIANTMGYFACPIYANVQLQADTTFSSLLEQVTERHREAYQYADFSYLEAQQPRADFTRNTCFNWVAHSPAPQTNPAGAAEDPLACSAFPLDPTIRNRLEKDVDPILALAETADEASGGLQFPANRFSLPTMERFGRNYLHFLRALTTRPHQRVLEIPLIP